MYSNSNPFVPKLIALNSPNSQGRGPRPISVASGPTGRGSCASGFSPPQPDNKLFNNSGSPTIFGNSPCPSGAFFPQFPFSYEPSAIETGVTPGPRQTAAIRNK